MIRELALQKLPSLEKNAVVSEIGEVADAVPVDDEGMRIMLRDFAKRSKFAQAFETGRELYLGGQEDTAYGYMMQRLEEIRSIAFATTNRIWLAESFEDRMKLNRMRQFAGSEPIPTGIHPYDRLTYGGIPETQIFCILSYSKGGKTMWLRHVSAIAMRMRRKILFIQLEGTGEDTAMAFDAWFSGQTMADLKSGQLQASKLAQVKASYEELKGLCVIRCMDDWNVTCMDIEAEIRELCSGGFNPELVAVDYMDLLRPSDGSTGSETEMQTKSSKELKTLAKRNFVAIHTASQVNRPREGSENVPHIIRASKIADAYAKVRPLDLWGSLNRTNKEAEKGFARIFVEGYRHGKAPLLFPVRTDYATSSFAYDPTLSISSESREVVGSGGVLLKKEYEGVQTKPWWDN
jgi:KaiC/GvpD/RAD55 family RecA-like ATPase